MRRFTELDEAELRLEMRRRYHDVGYLGCLDTVYHLVVGMKILLEVIREERTNEER